MQISGKVKDIFPLLKVGMRVRLKENGFVEGEIGELNERGFFIWQNKRDGSCNISPATKGYKYSWVVTSNDYIHDITILSPTKFFHPKLQSSYKNL